jgi:hypothetical protein
MAVSNERFSWPDQVWFDASNPGVLHDALRIDYARARAAVERRPSLRRHMADCGVCQTITAAVENAAPPSTGRRRIKLVITTEQMHALLGLPARFEIVHMFADNDPNLVTILVAGEELSEVPSTAAAPTIPLEPLTHLGRRMQKDTTDGAS